MRYLIPAVLLIVGLIHLLPAVGVLSTHRLTSLYGVAVDGPDLEILMRHRAVLFGLLGLFLVHAAWHRKLHLLALVAALASIGSFLGLAWAVGGYNPLLSRIVLVDVLALALVLVGLAVALVQRHGG